MTKKLTVPWGDETDVALGALFAISDGFDVVDVTIEDEVVFRFEATRDEDGTIIKVEGDKVG